MSMLGENTASQHLYQCGILEAAVLDVAGSGKRENCTKHALGGIMELQGQKLHIR